MRAYTRVIQEMVLEHAAQSITLATSLRATKEDRARRVRIEQDRLRVTVGVTVVQIKAEKPVLRNGRRLFDLLDRFRRLVGYWKAESWR